MKVHTFGVDDYIRYYESGFEQRGIYEAEIWSQTQQHRRLAQRWGTCVYRWSKPDGPPSGRSQVTMQFVHDGERWWIISMAWDMENDDHPIAPQYLPNP